MPTRTTTLSLKPVAVDRSARRTNFFDLPAEIRNIIYELTFKNEVISFPKVTQSNKKGRAHALGVLMVSRQIYNEAILLFYSQARLHFEVADKMLNLLRKLGAKKRNLLKLDVFVDSDTEISSASENEAWQIVSRAMKERTVLERRMRDCGVTLQPGMFKMRMKCWSAG